MFYYVRLSLIFNGSIDRVSEGFEKVRYSMRFDGLIFDSSIDQISEIFEKVRYSSFDNG